MFVFVLKLAAEKKLLAGKTVAVDSSMLEADAAMRSIVRRDTGEDWKTYLQGLAAAAGLENPTDEEPRLDSGRTPALPADSSTRPIRQSLPVSAHVASSG